MSVSHADTEWNSQLYVIEILSQTYSESFYSMLNLSSNSSHMNQNPVTGETSRAFVTFQNTFFFKFQSKKCLQQSECKLVQIIIDLSHFLHNTRSLHMKI